MARTARNVNVRLMGKIQQPPFKYTILFSETPKSYEKKIYLQSNNHADRKPSQLIKKEKKTHVSKTGRNKIRRKNPKKL